MSVCSVEFRFEVRRLEGPNGCAGGKSFREGVMAFKSAEERVDEDAFDSVWAVLIGDSSWKEFITPAADITKKNLPKRPFRVVPPAEYAPELAALDKSADPNDTPGVTDKRKGIVWVQGFFGTKSREGMMGHALHELVHLVSHKQGMSDQDMSTAKTALGSGLLEGLVELITTDILTTQKIKLAESNHRGHQKRVPVVQDLMATYGIGGSILGPALFRGETERLIRITEVAFSTAGWMEIKRLTTSDNPEGAKRRMAELRAKEEKANPGAFDTRKKQAGPAKLTPPTIRVVPVPVFNSSHYGMSPPPPIRS
jgi:hypothetical protein